jgi:plasmid stabilization system protein ParE
VIEPRRRALDVLLATRADIAMAFDWYEDQSAGLGFEFLRAPDAVFESAARTPELYPIVRGETRRALVRRFPYGVFFRVKEPTVVVEAVIHARRDPSVWQRRTSE